ncbi:MAG: acyl carrier protein, partial [Candidatus Acidiferrales bacterium]
MPDEIAEKVLTVLASVKRIPRESISLDSGLQELGVDSLDTIVLVSELEDQMKIVISDEAVRSIRSVRDIVEGVRKLAPRLPLNS